MPTNPANPWKKLKSEIIYKNKWYSVRRDEVITPSGEPGEYNVIDEPDGVFIIALGTDDKFYLIENYRYTTSMQSLEVPAGGSEGQEPLAAAKRELQEETGLTADTWTSLGKFQADNGKTNSFDHVFIARGLHRTKDHAQKEEGITGMQKVTLAQALAMIKDGRITDGHSIAAITLAALHLQALK